MLVAHVQKARTGVMSSMQVLKSVFTVVQLSMQVVLAQRARQRGMFLEGEFSDRGALPKILCKPAL